MGWGKHKPLYSVAIPAMVPRPPRESAPLLCPVAMVDTRRSSAGKRQASSKEASPPTTPPAVAPDAGASEDDAAGASASVPVAEAASPPTQSRSAKRAKGKTTRLVLAPVMEAAAKAVGRVIESSQLSVPAVERFAGAVAASSTASNSGARKKRTPRRLAPSDETTVEEMTQWKTRHRAASSRTHAWARLISQSSQV